MVITPVVVGIVFRLIYASDVGLFTSLSGLVGGGSIGILDNERRRVLGPRLPGRVGVDAADLPDPAGRPAVAPAGAVRGGARRRRGHLANVRGSHAADAGAGAGGCDRAAHDRRVHDVRPGLRAHPRRPGHGDAADLDLRLRHVLPLPAVRLRRGHAADGGAGRPGLSRSSRSASCAGRRRRREGSAHHRPRGSRRSSRSSRSSGWSRPRSSPTARSRRTARSTRTRRRSQNYRSLFSGRDFGSYLTNSIGITAISVLISLVLGTLAAYSLARYRLPLGARAAHRRRPADAAHPAADRDHRARLPDRRATAPAQHVDRPDRHLHGVQRLVRRLDDGELLPRDPGRPRGGRDGRRRLALHGVPPHRPAAGPAQASSRRRSSP